MLRTRSLLVGLLFLGACGDDPAGGGGTGMPASPNGDVPPGELPPADSFVEVKGTDVVVSDSIACALTLERKIVCWAPGGYQSTVRWNALGKNAIEIPTPVPAKQLSAGYDSACALLDDGSVRCWGQVRGNTGGGTASSPEEGETVLVAALPKAESVSVGYEKACALAAGRVYCWDLDTSTATEIPGITDAKAVSMGNFGCAVRVDGHVMCWGDNDYGGVGVAPGNTDQLVPDPVEVPGIADVTAINAGATAACAITKGNVVCWGGRWSAQVTDEERLAPYPKLTVAGISGATSLNLRRGHTTAATPGCATTPEGLFCWDSDYGGAPTGLKVEEPGPVTAVALGDSVRCGVFAESRVKCWGRAGRLLGDGTFEAHPSPVYVPNIANAISLYSFGAKSCVLDKDRRAHCWGQDQAAMVDPRAEDDGRARPWPALDGASSLAISELRCGIFDGAVKCASKLDQPPVALPGIANAVDAVMAGGSGCALLADGKLSCWEKPFSGATPPPELITTVSDVKAAGLRDAVIRPDLCALHGNQVSCWNGIPRSTQTTPPSAIAEFAGATEWAISGPYQCALLPGGVTCLGPSGSGTTGAIAGTAGATQLTVGSGFGCAVIDGKVQCWGAAAAGQLGAGTFTAMDAPFPVNGVGVPTALVASGGHTCALQGDGRVMCWGSNANGAISPCSISRKLPNQVRLRW